MFVVLIAGLLLRLAETRDDRRRGPTGCAYRPGRRQLRADRNVVSVAASRRNLGPSA
ncbi:hypothetical protein PAXRUDRAFT_828174 [Paxillus rubicundulus Ve08.2h10]|uniref:Uncharacterized protein n=1 Tax=Paxillus rubicundulus Ve08.2h10 TaxID=930991 RepID=A0A0D0E1L9_9AGAM|nr:hypothetical protein PAXRUDRAFT_828174 [Paxillus rubicundulus Ve08.2h10]